MSDQPKSPGRNAIRDSNDQQLHELDQTNRGPAPSSSNTLSSFTSTMAMRSSSSFHLDCETFMNQLLNPAVQLYRNYVPRGFSPTGLLWNVPGTATSAVHTPMATCYGISRPSTPMEPEAPPIGQEHTPTGILWNPSTDTTRLPFQNYGTPSPPLEQDQPEHFFTYVLRPTQLNFQVATFYVEKMPNRRQGPASRPNPSVFTVQVLQPSGIPCGVTVHDDLVVPTRSVCIFMAAEAGIYRGSVKVYVGGTNGPSHITGSPFTIAVTRDYTHPGVRSITGTEPLTGTDRCGRALLWGIDVDHFTEKMYVADKESHQIRIFTLDAVELGRIGEPAPNRTFNRPCGLAVDKVNRQLIVTDKDSHRICIYSLDGQLIKRFGKYGHRNGEFRHPWGIAVSPNGELIAVADCANHRIQILNKEGRFLRKYGVFETNPTAYRRLFNMPRSVCFDNTGEFLYVTDFSRHSVTVFNVELTRRAEFVPPGVLKRPQGLAIDVAGNVLICDSRNNCIRVVAPNGALVSTIRGYEEGQFHIPQDVTVLPGGRLAIVDKNGTIQFY